FLFLGFPLIAVETMLSLALVLALTARRAAHLVRSAPSFVAGAPGRTIAWLGQPAQARVRLWGKVALGLLALLALAAYEMRPSVLESRLFSSFASYLTWRVAPGPSPRVVFPDHGPLDNRRGYTRIPQIVDRLESRGFRVVEQARFSVALATATRMG